MKHNAMSSPKKKIRFIAHRENILSDTGQD